MAVVARRIGALGAAGAILAEAGVKDPGTMETP